MANHSSPATSPREPLPALLNDRLAALRRRLVSWQLSGWFLHAALSVAVVVTISFFIDWSWRLEWLNRGLILIAALSAGLFALARIVRRWRQPPSSLALAGAVEAYLPASDRVLVSAIELHEFASSRRDSPVLVAATMQRALTIAARTDFADIVDRQRLRRRWFGVIILLALGGGFILGVSVTPVRDPALARGASPLTAARSLPLLVRTWFARNVLLRQIDWPQQTYLMVTGAERGKLLLPRGATQTVRVTVTEASHVVPELLQVDFAPRQARPVHGVRRVSSHDFELTIRNPLEPFRLRVRGGDAQTAWISVQLIDAPRLVNWELSYERPRYLAGDTVKLEAGRGPHLLPAGSRLLVRGQATSSLQQARWRHAQHLSTLDLTSTNRRLFAGWVEPDQLGSGLHTLELVDEHGFVPAEPIQVELQVVPDRPPDVAVEWRGATRLVTRQAELEAHITASDDWGLQAIRVELGRRDAAGSASANGTAPNDSAQKNSLDSKSTAGERTTIVTEEVTGTPRQQEVTTKLDLEPLKLSVGQVLSLQAVATDHQPGAASAGRSSEFLLRVVDEDELQTDLLNREKQQRQQLEQVVADELSLADELLQLQGNPDAGSLAAMRGRSQQLNVTLLAAATQLQQLILEARHNRLPAIATAMSQRLGQRVIPELRQVARQAAEEVQEELQAAWRESSDQVARVRQYLQRATAAQQQLSQRLQQAVSELNRVESYQEAVSQLHQLRRNQSELLEQASLLRLDAARLALEGSAAADRLPAPPATPPNPAVPNVAPGAAKGLQERIMQLAQGQRRLVRTWEDYQTRLPTLAQSLSETEPERSERITRVIGQARERMVSQLVAGVPDQLIGQQWDEAERGQRQVVRELRELLDILLNRQSREGDGAGLAEKLRGEFLELLNLQRAITTETRATAMRRGEDGQWKRAERLILARLSQQESQLVQRAAAIETLVGEAPGAVALLAIVSELRELLQQVAGDLSALRVDAELTGRQRVIEELLAELAGVLREESRAAEESEGEEPPMVPSEQSVAGAAPVVRPSAEWKLLRAAQLRLLKETQRLDEQQSNGPLDAAQERQLEQVIRRQEELQRLVERLLGE